MTKKLYQILEIPENASSDDIKKAYRAKTLKLHPDRFNCLKGKPKTECAGASGQQQCSDECKKKLLENEGKFKLVAGAYEILGDTEQKALYDQYGDNISSANIRRDYEEEEHVDPNIARMEEEIRRRERIIEIIKEHLRRMEKLDEESRKIHEKYLRKNAFINYQTRLADEVKKIMEEASNEISLGDLDPNLWLPYKNFYEKMYSLETEAEAIAFKEKIINIIREFGKSLDNPVKKLYFVEIKECFKEKEIDPKSLPYDYRERLRNATDDNLFETVQIILNDIRSLAKKNLNQTEEYRQNQEAMNRGRTPIYTTSKPWYWW